MRPTSTAMSRDVELWKATKRALYPTPWRHGGCRSQPRSVICRQSEPRSSDVGHLSADVHRFNALRVHCRGMSVSWPLRSSLLDMARRRRQSSPSCCLRRGWSSWSMCVATPVAGHILTLAARRLPVGFPRPVSAIGGRKGSAVGDGYRRSRRMGGGGSTRFVPMPTTCAAPSFLTPSTDSSTPRRRLARW